MLRQLLAGLVFLGSLQSAALSFAEEASKACDENIGTPESDKACLTERIDSLKQELRNLSAAKAGGSEKATVANLLEDLESTKKKLAAVDKELKFVGFDWGIAAAFTSLKGEKAIKEAKVIGGVVRVTDEYSHSAGLMLETHYYVQMRQNRKQNQTMGIGPFVAIRVADSKNTEIGAYGFGIMMGGQQDGPKIKSFNFGLGYFVDTKVKRLGNGVVEGQPLPAGETELRLRNSDATGWMAILAATF